MLAILTGLNGSGKSQLLQIIALAVQSPNVEINGAKVRIEQASIQPNEMIFRPSNWSFEQPSSVNQSNVSSILDGLTENISRNVNNPQLQFVYSRLQEETDELPQNLSREEILKLLPQEAILSRNIDPGGLLNELSILFFRYRLRYASMVLQNREASDREIYSQLGRPPWETVNDIFDRVGLGYQVSTPADLSMDSSFHLMVVSNTGDQIDFSSLSSGEMTLLALVLLLYNSREQQVVPKLMLLDEPDAFLHTSKIKSFYDVIRSVFVRDFDCRVITTTHRPDTIAFAHENELFEVLPDGDRIRAVIDRTEIVSRISANLLAVLPNTRCVLVEDERDAEFYKLIGSTLSSEYGIQYKPIPIFQPVSVGKGKEKISGGKTQVYNWVKKLTESGISHLVHGLIDRDQGNEQTEFVHVLNRNSVENYIFDPINIFMTAIEEGVAKPEIAGLIQRGDEIVLRNMSGDDLQIICDKTLAPLQERLKEPDETPVDVTFMSGQQVSYPRWVMDINGHELERLVMQVYKSDCSTKNIFRSIERLRMIPVDLHELFLAITTPTNR